MERDLLTARHILRAHMEQSHARSRTTLPTAACPTCQALREYIRNLLIGMLSLEDLDAAVRSRCDDPDGAPRMSEMRSDLSRIDIGTVGLPVCC